MAGFRFVLVALFALTTSVVVAEDEEISTSGSDVITLTTETFAERVDAFHNIVIHFYEPDCARCELHEDILNDVSVILKGHTPTVRFSKMDVSAEGAMDAIKTKIPEGFGSGSMPVFKAFKGGEAMPWGAAPRVESMTHSLKQFSMASAEDLKALKKQPGREKEKLPEPEGSHVVEADVDSFDELVERDGTLIVSFIQPGCGECTEFDPVFREAASLLKDESPAIRLAKVDLTNHTNKAISRRAGCKNGDTFPILKVFNGPDMVAPWVGPRDLDGFVNFAKAVSEAHVRSNEAKAAASAGGDAAAAAGGEQAHGGEL